MRKKPPSGDQPSLFSTNFDDSIEQPKPVSYSTEGDTHAVQDHSSRTPATTNGFARAATEDTQAPADTGDLRQGAEGVSPSLEDQPLGGESGQRPDTDREPGPGDGAQGTG